MHDVSLEQFGPEHIDAAAKRLRGVITATPLLEFASLNERLGGRIMLKAENLQRMGSFKIRGAYNAIAGLSEHERRNGVVAWSSGNHAQGVALAARLFSIPAHIVMPHDAPAAKAEAVRALGARIVTYDRYSEDREAIATALAEELACPLVPSYDDMAIIAGQGTVGLEILAAPQLNGQMPDQVLVCCGGGGLTAGIATAVHARAPDSAIFAVEPTLADDTARSLAAGERLSNPARTRSVCDALLTPTPGALTFPINQQHLAGVLTVSDEEALHAVGYAYRRLRLVLEPGGAVALAALLFGRIDARDKLSVAVLSGGNISDAMMQRALAVFDASE